MQHYNSIGAANSLNGI